MITIALTVEAYIRLIAHDIFATQYDFAALHEHLKTLPVRKVTPKANQVKKICAALDRACCFYPKQARCLQRSAVLTKMLRSRGLQAHMIIGAQKLPFRAHAWVELDGRILNDRLASREKFLVLEVL